MSQKASRESWTAYAEAHGLVKTVAVELEPVRSKYGARRTLVDGIWFASKRESDYYIELKIRQAAGEIADLELQPAFPLHVMRLAYSECPIHITKVGVYTADFSYLDLRTGECKIEDVKSEPTRKGEAYRLRKRIVEAVHGITVTEVE